MKKSWLSVPLMAVLLSAIAVVVYHLEPQVYASPEIEIKGNYTTEQAESLAVSIWKANGGSLHPYAPKLKITVQLGYDPGIRTVEPYTKNGDPNHLALEAELEGHTGRSDKTINEVALDGPVDYKMALYVAALKDATKELIAKKRKALREQ